jgi:hypothetical protein
MVGGLGPGGTSYPWRRVGVPGFLRMRDLLVSLLGRSVVCGLLVSIEVTAYRRRRTVMCR